MSRLARIKMPSIQFPKILNLPPTRAIVPATPDAPAAPTESAIQRVSEELLQTAIRHIDSQDAFKAIRTRHKIRRTDGHGVIQTRAIHKNVCKAIIENRDLRVAMAPHLIRANHSADEAIGFHVFKLYSALRALLTHPRIVDVVLEAAEHLYDKGNAGTFSLTYNNRE